MKNFTAVNGSTIYDVCLNTYGTLNLLGKLMDDNNYPGVDTLPVAGQVFTFDDTLVASPSASRALIIPGRKYATAFKRVVISVLLFMLAGTAIAQKKWEPINGNYKWVDSLQFLRYKNNAAKDSVLSTDSAGKMILVAKGGGVLPADTAGKWVGSVYKKPGTDSVFFQKGSTAYFAYRDSAGGGSGGGIDSMVIKSVPYVDSFFTYSSGVKNWRGNVRKRDGLLSGGEVTRITGYDFNATAAYYIITGTNYATSNYNFTIPTPDPGDSARYYAVTATSANTVQVLPGEMSSTPIFPTIEPSERVLLGFIYVSPDSIGLVPPPVEALWLKAGAYIINANPGGVQITNGLFFDQPGRVFSGLIPLRLQSNVVSGTRVFTGVIGGNSGTGTTDAESGGGDLSNTSGTKTVHLISGRMLHSSGSGTVNMLDIMPQFSQAAGGAGSTVNGLYVHGLLTNLFGTWNALKIDNGDVLFNRYAGAGTKLLTVVNGILDTTALANINPGIQDVIINDSLLRQDTHIDADGHELHILRAKYFEATTQSGVDNQANIIANPEAGAVIIRLSAAGVSEIAANDTTAILTATSYAEGVSSYVEVKPQYVKISKGGVDSTKIIFDNLPITAAPDYALTLKNDTLHRSTPGSGSSGTLQTVVTAGNTADREIYIEGARIHWSGDSSNLMVGPDAGGGIDGQENTGFGGNTLLNAAGDQNTAVGLDAGNGSSANRSVYVGTQAGQNNTFDDAIVLGGGVLPDSARQLVAGNMRLDLGKLTAVRKIRVPNSSGTLALTSDINPGTVTTLTRTTAYGITVVIANPSTTPDITAALDSSVVFNRLRAIIDSAISAGGGGGSPDTVRTVRETGIYVDTVLGVRYLKGDTLILATRAYVKHYVDSMAATKVTANSAIVGATKTKITYDSKGLVTAGADIGASDLPTGIDAAKINTGVVSNTEFNRLDGISSSIIQASDTAAMLARDTSSAYLLADFNTSSTTAVNTGLGFPIGANEAYRVVVVGTASKATSASGLKLAIGAPTGATIKGLAMQGGSTLSSALTNSIISAINTLGSTFATGTGVEVGFRWEFTVVNGATPGSITLQAATVTSNTATIYAYTSMLWHKTKGL